MTGAVAPVELPAPRVRLARSDVLVLGAVLATALALKRFYSTASAEELGWVLAPTASLVERFTGVHFIWERGAGFVSEGRNLVIAPACAGINFLVITLVALAFGFVPQLGRPIHKASFAAASLLGGYASMLAVNATRIALGVVIGPRFAAFGVDHADIHRALGVATYLTTLWALFAIANVSTRRICR
jgi:exosortase K